jgi:hypothetical protein
LCAFEIEKTAIFQNFSYLYKPTTASNYYADAVPAYAVDGFVLDYPYIRHSARFDTAIPYFNWTI